MSGDDDKILLGISSCLLGQAVRYDGGHKRDTIILDTLGRHFAFLPICPEVAIGLGVPRQPIRLAAVGEGLPRAVSECDAQGDVTERLQAYAQETVGRLGGICGYIFKSKSPSCGMAQVAVQGGSVSSGVYARVLMQALPQLPVEDEARLRDPLLRDDFIERVLAYRAGR